jgi:alpha-tubulin suppressor-like RCC1 family protein/inosine-uridine nucleoside N-ribohydrolase
MLVAGGWSSGYLSSAELYDPTSGTWTLAGAMTTARDGHTATLLPNGKMLVAGGENASSYLSSAELYDPEECAVMTHAPPVKIILDADMASDCDDLGAVAVLHALANQGKAQILGMVCDVSDPNSPLCLSAINTYYERPEIPIGYLDAAYVPPAVVPGAYETIGSANNYTTHIADTNNYPRNYVTNSVPNALEVYTNLLQQSSDVTIVSIGSLQNLYRLLITDPDLVKTSVTKLVVMGGSYPTPSPIPDYNFSLAWFAASYVVAHWPTPVVFTSLGGDIITGTALTNDDVDVKNPIRVGYDLGTRGARIDNAFSGKDIFGRFWRPSWDQIAVLYAVEGTNTYFTESDSGMNIVLPIGVPTIPVGCAYNLWTTLFGGNHTYLQPADTNTLATYIESLMTKKPIPRAPSNLLAIGVSTNQVDLTWHDNSNNETGFAIERSLDGMAFGQTATVGAGVTNYSDVSLNACTLYYYRIRAQNSSGMSDCSNIAGAQSQGCIASRNMIAAGDLHTVALRSDETVWAWGYNCYGQLGNGTTSLNDPNPTPVQVSGLTGVIAVAAGWRHTVGLKSDGTVWAWGYNDVGQLGDGTTINRSSPIQVSGLTGAIAVATFGSHTVALKSDGTVWAWGWNYYGQLGNGTTSGYTPNPTPVQASDLTGVIAVAGGGGHTVAVKSDGTVWAWGANDSGQLGDDTTTNRSSPIQVSGLTESIAVAGGGGHTVAVKSDGTVWAWGYNADGQLGDGTTNNRSSPIQVSGLTGVVAVAAGLNHTVALKSDGTVWAWGQNLFGQLGDGPTSDQHAPVQVSGLTGVIAVAASGLQTVALKSDGTVWAWGYNLYGQLGDGTTTTRYTPVQVNGFALFGGNLQVTISPPAAVSAGAQWQVDNGAWQNSGVVLTNLASGSHVVHFNAVPEWIPSGDMVVSISGGATNSVVGTYTVQTRIIGVSGNLSFGSVPVGTSAQRVLMISNNGNSGLHVTSINCPSGFSSAWNGTIAAGSSAHVIVTFAPQADTTYGGSITVDSDATAGSASRSVSGTGITTCSYALSSASTNLTAIAVTGGLVVYADIGCGWSASSGSGWIHTTSSGTGNGPAIFTVDANTGDGSRIGALTIAGQAFTIAQAGSVDTVGDGIPDWWRARFFSTVDPMGQTTNSYSCATCDADGTGQNNLFKYVTGLDPTNPASLFVLRIQNVPNQPTRKNLIYWPIADGRTYVVESTTDLVAGVWIPQAVSAPFTNLAQVTVFDPNASGPKKFYRVSIYNSITNIVVQDSIGDGITDSWRAQYFPNVDLTGATTNNLSCATCDADGTGQNNLFKYLAGLNPTNPASVFRITSLTRNATNMTLAWQAGGGRTNVVQASSVVGTNTFNDISAPLVLPGSGDVFTNWVDNGGATNSPTRFYRIRLGP